MEIIQINPNLHLIPLKQNLPGFSHFISTWVYKGEKNFLVDPGPAYTIPHLAKALKNLDIKKLDAILLTHIHIDHAGGTGDLLADFPDTPVICHESGIRHMASPAKLWEGSLKTLGKTAEAYGPIAPIPENLLKDAATFNENNILPILTPGHAPHHVSYLFESILFAGEVGGVFSQLPDEDYYLRPATPPRFFLETSVKSIEKVLEIPHDLMCYGHFGATDQTPKTLLAAKDQLLRWADILDPQMENADSPDFINTCIQTLLEKDPLLKGFFGFSPNVQERERGFMKNAILGFKGYFKSR